MISINLLPKEKQAYYAGLRRNRRLLFWSIVATGVMMALAIILIGATIYNRATLASEKSRLEQTQEDIKRFAEIEKLVLTARDRVAALTSAEKARVQWSEIATELAEITPPQVSLASLTINIATQPHVTLSGLAVNKERVAAFQERMEDSDRFEDVVLKQVGLNDDGGTITTSFSIEANLTGVTVPKSTQKSEEK